MIPMLAIHIIEELYDEPPAEQARGFFVRENGHECRGIRGWH